ncbi:hypothetical protein [Dolichospermum sp. LEGE 00246]|nr:hypothetical protein [Dolichospermum sp. LEGE 00246]
MYVLDTNTLIYYFKGQIYIVTTTLPTSVNGWGMGCPSSFNTSR